MNIKCPHCETEYEIAQTEFGRFVNCEICRKGFVAGVSKGKSMPSQIETANAGRSMASPVCSQRKKSSMPLAPKLTGMYVCTACGEFSTSPIKVNNKGSGCVCFVIAAINFVFMFMGMLPLPIHLVFSAFLIIMGFSYIIKGNRTKCRKCGKLDTLISATSPRGKQMYKEVTQSNIQDYATAPLSQTGHTPQADISERLKKAELLFNNGLISIEEYNAQRKRILDSM
ncbi:MAG: SHOCT domain-containing protein [Kiritimatiellae bacterium]|nr:SHOCT domain-containing protein [Kiritimatiellia bacterium]